ncbi:MAG: reverse transcriptase family protein [Candidatus Thiodiazotropha endolucinida]|nr:reverse transcriptase family protein [Candidatus Thiodiazotropha endolucinida]
MPTPSKIHKAQVIGKLHSVDNIYDVENNQNEQCPSVNVTAAKTTACSPEISPSDEDYIKIAKQLQIPFDSCMLPDDQKRKLMIFLGKNSDVFAKDSSDIGCTHLHYHRIETGDHPPYRQRPYRQSPQNIEIIQQHVQQMLKDGIITESNSTWAAPVVLVSKKKTKEMRFAIDYRGLNARTQVINFPIPDLQDALDSVGTAQSKIFSVMDLKSSFWQIPLHPETADRSAFITHDGCYQFTRVPYGITNGPMAFQMLMSKVLRGINFKFALVFIDDILCHSATIDQHLDHLSAIFQRLRHANLKLNPKKCQFAAQKVEYLGHILSENGIEANSDKTDIVRNFHRPRTRNKLNLFLV